ncbi:hypothetical protein RND81_11G048600 [Saponaria officinalis]|uniref:X8 domain-containing protein n=1 Tax=Saponaria officinalis TaxID=3572 RepID=A0AAW1HHT6_SAPOF
MAIFLFFALFFSFITHSSAQYCLCKPGSQAPDPYKKVIDYACGNGASCGAIQSGGPCYQANNIQGICSYAANSYYQNKKSLGATCDFGGVAAPSGTLPSDLPSGCSFPTSGGGPVSTGGGVSTSTPGGVSTGAGGGGGMGTGTGTGAGSFSSPMGLGPTGSYSDPNGATSLIQISSYAPSLFLALVSGLFILF